MSQGQGSEKGGYEQDGAKCKSSQLPGCGLSLLGLVKSTCPGTTCARTTSSSRCSGCRFCRHTSLHTSRGGKTMRKTHLEGSIDRDEEGELANFTKFRKLFHSQLPQASSKHLGRVITKTVIHKYYILHLSKLFPNYLNILNILNP